MTTILVTGGAGYIGGHVCKALAGAGYLPVAYDNLATGHRQSVKWGPLEEGDISDRETLDNVIARLKPAAVMHFAGFIAAGESVNNPGKYFRNNVGGSLTLLEAVRDHKIDKFIFSSTAAVYGNPQYTPLDEKHPKNPINPYGKSKLMIEEMLEDFGRAHALRHVSLRYFNASGADPASDLGENHDPETHLIPLVIQSALKKSGPIQVFGTDYSTPDGTAIRDYIHVTDLAEAHLKALHYLEKGGQSAAFNLGTGQGYSVTEVIQTVETVTGMKVATQKTGRREGDPPILIAEAGLSARILDWKPLHSDLKEIISTAWKWHRR